MIKLYKAEVANRRAFGKKAAIRIGVVVGTWGYLVE